VDSEKYLRIAENTGGWQEILADGAEYWEIAENTRSWSNDGSRNVCGWLFLVYGIAV
jgi:hypothetical protein